MNLRGLDLNLLVALDALLCEKSVTRAAERVHISQPGMSAALHKLRLHFSDQLLERSGRNLKLTPRAKELAGPIQDILSQLRILVDARAVFNPIEGGRFSTGSDLHRNETRKAAGKSDNIHRAISAAPLNAIDL